MLFTDSLTDMDTEIAMEGFSWDEDEGEDYEDDE
jgi:hypothetical protein